MGLGLTLGIWLGPRLWIWIWLGLGLGLERSRPHPEGNDHRVAVAIARYGKVDLVHLPIGGHGDGDLLERGVVVVGIGKHHLVRVIGIGLVLGLEIEPGLGFSVRVRVRAG